MKNVKTKYRITTALVSAYHLCKRKAFLLLCGKIKVVEHEHERILAKRADTVRSTYLSSLEGGSAFTEFPRNRQVSVDDLEAACDALSQRIRRAPKAHVPYEPHVAVGTHSVTELQRLGLAFAGYVVGRKRRYRPATGHITTFDHKTRQVRLDRLYPTIETIVDELRRIEGDEESSGPPLILNEHCPTCPFQSHSLHQAENEDNLSLLARMTPKLIQKYEKRGIFALRTLACLQAQATTEASEQCTRQIQRRAPSSRPSDTEDLC